MAKKTASAQTKGTLKAQQSTIGIVQQLDALCAARQNWEATDYKKANEGLYGILANCQDVFEGRYLKANEAARAELRQELTNKLTAANVKVQKNTNTLTMFVRYVFNSDRKRAHG
jgi:hypothetical protein